MIDTYKKYHLRPHLLDSASQTEDQGALASLEERLRRIDMEYINRSKNGSDAISIDEKMIKYQREVDNRMRQELSAEIDRIREVEISAIRIEEANKYRQMLQQYRSEQDFEYKQRLA